MLTRHPIRESKVCERKRDKFKARIPGKGWALGFPNFIGEVEEVPSMKTTEGAREAGKKPGRMWSQETETVIFQEGQND